MERLSPALKVIVMVEVIFCFGPAALLLLLGLLFGSFSLSYVSSDPLNWEPALVLVCWLVGGVAGMVSLFIVIAALYAKHGAIPFPHLVLTGVVSGCVAIVSYVHPSFDSPRWPMLIDAIPLLASIHVAYLARDLLLQRQTVRKALICIAVLGLLIAGTYGLGVQQTHKSQAQLLELQAEWRDRRPRSYEYSISIGGHHDDGLMILRQVRVEGERVVAARYLAKPSPMDRTVQEPAERNARTIDLLFEEMLRAKRDGARVKAAFDPQFGYPTRIYVDSEREGWNLEMRSFEAIQ